MSLLKRNIHSDTISPLKQAQERIISNELKYRAFIENSACGMAVLTPEGKSIYISPSIKDLLGYIVEEGLHLNLFTHIHPADIFILIDTIKKAMTKPRISVKVDAIRIHHADGSWRWIEGILTNMPYDSAAGGIIYNFIDVTEKKLAEEKLIHSNRLYAFISKINQSIVRADTEQTLIDEVCKISIETGKFKMAWISNIDEPNTQLHLAAQYNLTLEEIEILQSLYYHKKEHAAEVIKNNGCYIINDFTTETANIENTICSIKRFGISHYFAIKKSGQSIFRITFIRL